MARLFRTTPAVFGRNMFATWVALMFASLSLAVCAGRSASEQISGPSAPIGVSAYLMGPQSVRMIWSSRGLDVKNFYLFHVAAVSTPRLDLKAGGWHRDLVVDRSARQADLSIAPAHKPRQNHYLVCAQSGAGVHACSVAVNESPPLKQVELPIIR